MAAIPSERSGDGERSLRRLFAETSLGSLVLALAVPFLFLHERYHPTTVLELGSTALELRASDAAVLAVYLAAATSAARHGVASLGSATRLWIAGGGLLAWLALSLLRPASLGDARVADHLVSYLKLLEYSALALCVPLLVRSRQDLSLLLSSVVCWGAAATAVATAQFAGWSAFEAWSPGWRQPSFLGHHDLASLSALVLSFAAARIVAGRSRVPVPALAPLALVAGALGIVLAGSVAAAVGLAVGALALLAAARPRFRPGPRRLVGLAALVAAVLVGVATIRDSDLGSYLRFLGLRGDEPPAGVESYSQRTVLVYIGLRIFADYPLLGVGWQRSSRPEVFEPYVDDARARFPDVVEAAFPAEGREWGVQNLYVQMLADAGVIGLALLLAVGGAALVLAWRAVRTAPDPWAAGAGLLALCGLVTLAGEWASMGIVAGIPLQAATAIVLGLAAAGAAMAGERAHG